MKKNIITVLLALLGIAFGAGAQMRWAPVVGINGNNLVFKQDPVYVSPTFG